GATAQWWDTNGATAGAGATPTGTWSTSSATWNTSSAGTNATINWVNGNTLKNRFAAGTDAVNAYVITVSGTVQTVQMGIEEAAQQTFTGGTILFVADTTTTPDTTQILTGI